MLINQECCTRRSEVHSLRSARATLLVMDERRWPRFDRLTRAPTDAPHENQHVPACAVRDQPSRSGRDGFWTR